MNILGNKKSWLLLIAPALIFYLIAVFIPIGQSFLYSLVKWNGIRDPQFIGFQNYIKMFGDDYFWNAVTNNLVYVLVVVCMQVGIGLIFALLLTYIDKGVAVFKTVYYMPAVIVTVAIAQMFRNAYSIEPMGLFNIILDFFGADKYMTAWLSNSKTALVAVSIPEGWRFIGMYMVIFYAALISVPKELEEAANIDGASILKTIFCIKLPYIRNVISLCFIMCTTGALRGFDIPYIIGVPGSTTEMVTMYMYKKAFSSMQYGYGSTIAVFIVLESIIAVSIIAMVFRKSRKERNA